MSTSPKDFRDALLEITPQLRAYARSLCGAQDVADDLVQDTLLKAWEKQDLLREMDRLKAWAMTIMRNEFYGQCRKGKFIVEDADGHWADTLVSEAEQESVVDLRDLADALTKIGARQREALVLIFVNELSYEEAAKVADCPVGTMKSRVHRARIELAEELGWCTNEVNASDNSDLPSVFDQCLFASFAKAKSLQVSL